MSPSFSQWPLSSPSFQLTCRIHNSSSMSFDHQMSDFSQSETEPDQISIRPILLPRINDVRITGQPPVLRMQGNRAMVAATDSDCKLEEESSSLIERPSLSSLGIPRQ